MWGIVTSMTRPNWTGLCNAPLTLSTFPASPGKALIHLMKKKAVYPVKMRNSNLPSNLIISLKKRNKTSLSKKSPL